jgi:pantetheine-phosphate adenylyltransferase
LESHSSTADGRHRDLFFNPSGRPWFKRGWNNILNPFSPDYYGSIREGNEMAQKKKGGEEKDMGKVAIYAGSFDPITYGHIDIIERGLEIFDKVIVAIANNVEKRSLFTIEERLKMTKTIFQDTPNVIVDSFKGLLVDYVSKTNAKVILRGLRATSDFEYEFHMASMNRSLNTHLDTLFMMTSKDYFFVSSRTIKEVARLGGGVEGLVPDLVVRRLKEKFKLPVTKRKHISWDD